jgi:type VI secretion system secreted protein Hcp
MRRTGFKGLIATGLVAAGVAASTTAVSAQDMFLKITNIPGESQDSKHKGEIDVLSWSWGHSTAKGKTKPGALPQACIQDLSVTKFVDQATTGLIMLSVLDQVVPEATLTVRRGGDQGDEAYLVIKLTNVSVSSFQTGGAAGQHLLTENVALTFESVRFEYTPQRPDGSMGGTVSAEYSTGKCPK